MRSEYILAIDLGTSGPKVALVDASNGNIIAHEFEENQLIFLPDGGAEQDPHQWWQTICKASKRLLGNHMKERDNIIAINTTSQWSGTVCIDQYDQPIGNCINWMDTRGQEFIKEITRGIIKVEGYGLRRLLYWLHKTAGVPSRSGKDPVAHILYVKHKLPEVYRQTSCFLEPKDYINLRLSGIRAASFDSIALHWVCDIRKSDQVRYDPVLLRWTGLDQNRLPELRPQLDILGPVTPQAADALGVPDNTPVVIGTPDLQSAAIGSGAVRDYEGHLYVGTSSWLTCHVPFKKTAIKDNMATLPSAIPARYFIANEQEVAGEAMKFLRDKVFYRQDALGTEKPGDALNRINQIAADVPRGSDGLYFLPWLYGERTPIEDHTVRGGFYNLSINMHRGHMARAVFEGVAYNSRWLLEAVERFIKRPMPYLHLIGGGANSDLWCQIFADVTGRAMRRIKNPIQANARGAGLLGSIAMGRMQIPQIADSIEYDGEFTPESSAQKLHNERFKDFINIYHKNKKIFAELNKKQK